MSDSVLLLLYLYSSCVTAVNNTSNLDMVPTPYQKPCGANQVYDSCRQYENACSGFTVVNPGQCLAGCFCVDNYFKAPNNSCVLLKDCPHEMFYDDRQLSIDECQPDEVFVWCGWCEGSCSEPASRCPGACTRGCLCRPPLLRHYTGHCVEERDCLPRKCPTSDEEYECRYGCEVHCKPRPCLRSRRCRLGCHCKRGLLRNQNGTCVAKEQCFNNTTLIKNITTTLIKE